MLLGWCELLWVTWSALQLSSTAAADTWKVPLALSFVLFTRGRALRAATARAKPPNRSDDGLHGVGAAVDVQLLPGDAKVLLRGHCHHRQRLVDLKQVNVADLQPTLSNACEWPGSAPW
jgi:hypothetical protein